MKHACVVFRRCMCNKMSDVRLSNASPVERVDARQQDNVRTSVRRNLFGRPNPEEIRRDAENSAREEVQRFRETYDFDLVEDRPLAPRSYDWVQDDDAPEFYSRQPHSRPRGSPGDSDRLDNDGGDRPSGLQPGKNGSKKRSAEDAGESCHLFSFDWFYLGVSEVQQLCVCVVQPPSYFELLLKVKLCGKFSENQKHAILLMHTVSSSGS